MSAIALHSRSLVSQSLLADVRLDGPAAAAVARTRGRERCVVDCARVQLDVFFSFFRVCMYGSVLDPCLLISSYSPSFDVVTLTLLLCREDSPKSSAYAPLFTTLTNSQSPKVTMSGRGKAKSDKKVCLR